MTNQQSFKLNQSSKEKHQPNDSIDIMGSELLNNEPSNVSPYKDLDEVSKQPSHTQKQTITSPKTLLNVMKSHTYSFTGLNTEAKHSRYRSTQITKQQNQNHPY